MPSAFILFGTWIVLAVPAACVLFPWTLLTRDITRLYRTAMSIIRAGLRCAGIRVQAEGVGALDPRRPSIFLSNHISNLDPPVLIPLIPGRVSVFLKRSLMKIPILGYGMRLGGFIPVDRDGRVESAIASVDMAQSVLASGVHIISFVEGTRSRDGRLQAFKKGPFYLAMQSGAPIVPVSIFGTEGLMRKGSLKIFPGTAQVIFHPAILPGEYGSREDLMEAVRQAIASGLPEWMRDSTE